MPLAATPKSLDAAVCGRLHFDGVVGIVCVIEMRRRVRDHECHPCDRVIAPLKLAERGVNSGVHVFGHVAAAARFDVRNLRGERRQIARERIRLRHERIGSIFVFDHADANLKLIG